MYIHLTPRQQDIANFVIEFRRKKNARPGESFANDEMGTAGQMLFGTLVSTSNLADALADLAKEPDLEARVHAEAIVEATKLARQ